MKRKIARKAAEDLRFNVIKNISLARYSINSVNKHLPLLKGEEIFAVWQEGDGLVICYDNDLNIQLTQELLECLIKIKYKQVDNPTINYDDEILSILKNEF